MKLTRIKLWGRFRLEDGREVNIHRGSRVGRGTDVYFYTESMRREYLRLCGREVDENGKSYTVMPEPEEPIDKSQLTGLAKAIDFVYGEDN